VHVVLVDEDVGSFEEGDEDLEEHEAALLLLVAEVAGRGVACRELEVGAFENEAEEVGVLVGETDVDLLLLVFSLLPLVLEVNPDAEGQADDGDDVAERLEDFQRRHATSVASRPARSTGADIAPRMSPVRRNWRWKENACSGSKGSWPS